MRIQLIQGLKWEKKTDYEGRMFLTDFTEEKAKEIISKVKQELPKLKLLGGDYTTIGGTAVKKLEKIAGENIELFVYGIKATLTIRDYSVLDREARDAIVNIIVETIDERPTERLPLYKHMLKIWPHTNSWSVVNNILAQAYGIINCCDEECIEIVAQGLLRDATSWESTMNAMMARALHKPKETLKQFEAVFDFMAIYGENMRGKHGIQLRSTVYSYKNSPMRLAFEAQPEEVQNKLRDMREIHLVNAKPMLAATRGMEQKTGGESCFPEVEKLLRQGKREVAQQYMREKFNIWKEYGWNELRYPDIIDLIGDLMRDPKYPFNDKQRLVNRLSSVLRLNRDNEETVEVLQKVYNLLNTYDAINDSDEEVILAGCAKLMARASSSTRSVFVSNDLCADLLKLIQRHTNMEVYARGQVDGTEDKWAIWGYMLRSYGLHPLISAVVEKMLRDTKLDNPEEVRLAYKTIATTFSPASQDRRVLSNAVPNKYISEHIYRILAYQDGSFQRNKEYMRDVIPAIVDALGKVINQETYVQYYRSIVTLLTVYFASLSDVEKRREQAVMNTVREWADNFHHAGMVIPVHLD